MEANLHEITQERLSYSLSVQKTYEMESETSNTVSGKTRQAISTAAITASLPQLVETFARSMWVTDTIRKLED